MKVIGHSLLSDIVKRRPSVTSITVHLHFLNTTFNRRVQGHGLLLCRQTFRRGSRASRSPSPSRLKANTVTRIARPGKIVIHGLISMSVRFCFKSQPQVGVGGCVPKPRKLSDASMTMAVPILSVEVTIIGARQLGSTR